MNQNEMPRIDPGVPGNAVRLYGEDDTAMEEFPVLKAFQQYIDAEQAKARKRLISLGIFFGILMGAVIAVFVVMLLQISERNQELNDRLVEYAMKDRERQAQPPVVVQPPVQQDNTALIALSSKLEEMQKKLLDSQKALIDAEKERARKAEEAAKTKVPSPEEKEIERLKALLTAEREKNDAEKARKREAELEEYRRKQYPELYEKNRPKLSVWPKRRKIEDLDVDDMLETDEAILKDEGAISYFDDEESDDDQPVLRKKKVKTVKAQPKADSNDDSQAKTAKKPEPPQEKQPPEQKKTVEPKKYKIPVEVKGKSSSWRIP